MVADATECKRGRRRQGISHKTTHQLLQHSIACFIEVGIAITPSNTKCMASHKAYRNTKLVKTENHS